MRTGGQAAEDRGEKCSAQSGKPRETESGKGQGRDGYGWKCPERFAGIERREDAGQRKDGKRELTARASDVNLLETKGNRAYCCRNTGRNRLRAIRGADRGSAAGMHGDPRRFSPGLSIENVRGDRHREL